MAAIHTFSETLKLDRKMTAAGFDVINTRLLMETEKSLVHVEFQVGAHSGRKLSAIFARVRDLSGGGVRYLLYSQDNAHLICVTNNGVKMIMGRNFDIRDYFRRISDGEPCGALQGEVEGPQMTDLPYVYRNVCTYIIDCCRALCKAKEQASTLSLM